MPLCGPGASKALFPNKFGGVTRLTNARIAYLVRQAQIEWDGDSLPQMAARWGVTRRRLRQALRSWRTSGVVPRLNPARRPRIPLIPEEVRRSLLAEWQRVRRGPSYLWRAAPRHGYEVSHRQVTAFARFQGLPRPNARKQRKRKRCRYERAHSGSLLHGDFHRTREAHPHCILWLDDASRMIWAGGEFDGPLTEHAIATVEKALEVAGRWNPRCARSSPIAGRPCSSASGRAHLGGRASSRSFGRTEGSARWSHCRTTLGGTGRSSGSGWSMTGIGGDSRPWRSSSTSRTTSSMGRSWEGPEAVGGGRFQDPGTTFEREAGMTRSREGIPQALPRELTERFRKHAARRWKERCARVEVRIRGRFAQVDAYLDDEGAKGKEEAVPTHLCRLEYAGRPDLWRFTFDEYGTERYERSYLPSGSMGGTPEECFDCAGLAFLSH